jgi:hypothetical protein
MKKYQPVKKKKSSTNWRQIAMAIIAIAIVLFMLLSLVKF